MASVCSDIIVRDRRTTEDKSPMIARTYTRVSSLRRTHYFARQSRPYQTTQSIRMSNDPSKNVEDGKFSSKNIGGQHQSGVQTGLEADMGPKSEYSKLETPAGVQEYVGVGKLKGKTALITGGDSYAFTNTMKHVD